MVKPYLVFNSQKSIEAEKNKDKYRKALYKLMNKAIYGKTMENLRNRFDAKLVKIEKKYVICTLKPSYVAQIFDNN